MAKEEAMSTKRGRIPNADEDPHVHQAEELEGTTNDIKTSSSYTTRQHSLHYPPYSDIHPLPHHYMPYHGSSTIPPSYSLESYTGSHPPRLLNFVGQGPPHPLSHYYMPYPVEPLEFIHDPQPCDVLSGRGGATNSHSGNRAFRVLVKQYQTQYLKAKKRDKPAVAAVVVEKIRATGGRFLRRHHVTSHGVVWVEIGDEKAREKTCQALREGAPEIRRRKAASSDGPKARINDGTESTHSSTTDRSLSEEDECALKPSRHTPIVRTTSAIEVNNEPTLSEALVIRPSMILIGQPNHPPIALSVDQLECSERETYLRDFFPPNPAVTKNCFGVKQIPTNEHHRQNSPVAAKQSKNNNEWRIATV